MDPICTRARWTRVQGRPNTSILRKGFRLLLVSDSRCAASYGPKVEQPHILLARIAKQKYLRPTEDMIDTFDTY